MVPCCRGFSAHVLLLLVVTAESISWGQATWPQWQGPNRDAISKETGLVQDIPAGGLRQLWRFENCGAGYGGPAIVDGRLYILAARDGVDFLLCIDTNSGDELWAAELGATYHNDWGDGPRSTPTVDGDNIYLLAPAGELYCVKTSDGSRVWSKKMQDLGGKIPQWGYSESPLVLGDRVFCTPGETQGAIAAFDKHSGELIWQAKELPDTAHYSSIVPRVEENRTVLVQLLFKELVGVDAENGKLLWSLPWPGNVAVIPTPILHEDQVYCTAGYGAGCLMANTSSDDAEVVYENKNMTNHHGGVILLDGHLYGYSDGKGWVCQDFSTGEIVWRERNALGKGAIAYADGRFYCLSEDEGELVMIDASSDGWEEHGRFRLEPQTQNRKPRGKIWTHPVIADGKLYLRDQDLLFCFDVKAERVASR